MRRYSVRLYADVGSLNDFCIARLVPNAPRGNYPQSDGRNSENGGEQSEHGRVERDGIVRRPPPEGYQWVIGGLFLLGGLLGLGIVWAALRR
jgi:hypothetical protein